MKDIILWSPEKIITFKLDKVSEAILDHFKRFVNTSLQLHMRAMLGEGRRGGGGNCVTEVGTRASEYSLKSCDIPS